MEIPLNSDKLADYASAHEGNNHLYVLEKLLRDMLPPHASKKCELSGTLTNSGNLSIVLEAINAGNHALCNDALPKLEKQVHKVQSQPSPMVAYNLFNPSTWLHNKALDIQDSVINSPVQIRDSIKNKVGEGLLEAESYADQPKNGAQQLLHIWLSSLAIVGSLLT